MATAGGDTSASGISALEDRFDGKKIGPKMIAFWEKWLERESFKKWSVAATSVIIGVLTPFSYLDGPH